MQRLFTNTAAHSALLQSARLSITAKGEEADEVGADRTEKSVRERARGCQCQIKGRRGKKSGAVDLHLHYSPLTLLIANHDAAL